MRFLPAIILVTVLWWAPLASAQEPPLPAATETPAASPNPTRPELNIPDIPLTVEPAPLVPNISPAPSKSAPPLEELDTAFKRSSLGKAVEEQRLHVEWRKLKNRTVQAPDLVAAKDAADNARTDLEKRNLLRAYYKLYYARMKALASTPELKTFLENNLQGILRTLDQPQVRPNPTASPSPSR